MKNKRRTTTNTNGLTILNHFPVENLTETLIDRSVFEYLIFAQIAETRDAMS